VSDVFDKALIPEFDSNWTERMGAYLSLGREALGDQGLSDWIVDNYGGLMKSWGDDSKMDRVMWAVHGSGTAKEHGCRDCQEGEAHSRPQGPQIAMKIHELLEDPKHWTQGAMARKEDGSPTSSRDSPGRLLVHACSCC
jgi:hypothetical protein